MEATKKAAPKKAPATKKAPAAKKAPAKKPAKAAAPVVEETTAPEAVITSEPVVEKAPIMEVPKGKSWYGVGRRKTSIAQVMMTAGNGTFTANKIALDKYFHTFDLNNAALQALDAVGLLKQVNFKAKVSGGGIHSQAEAVRLGTARALLLLNPEVRRVLKKLGYLMRDPRVKERKKPGLKRARRAPQFSKR